MKTYGPDEYTGLEQDVFVKTNVCWVMGPLLSKLVDNLTEAIHKIECKDCGCFFEYENVKDNLIKYECLSYNKE